MLPVAFQIGPIPVSGYWVMTMLGLAMTHGYLAFTNRRSGAARLPFVHIHNLCCLCILSIYIGGALLGLLVRLPEVVKNWTAVTADLPSFLEEVFASRVFYGGLAMLAVTLVLYVRHYAISGEAVAALFAPACPLFMVFGRLACFMGGCCYGIPVRWGVVFPEGSLAPAEVPLFPSQLAEALGNLLLFFLLLRLKKRVRRKLDLIWIYGAGYSILRFSLEFFRGDLGRGSLWMLSTSQWISLALALGVLVYLCNSKTQKNIKEV